MPLRAGHAQALQPMHGTRQRDHHEIVWWVLDTSAQTHLLPAVARRGVNTPAMPRKPHQWGWGCGSRCKSARGTLAYVAPGRYDPAIRQQANSSSASSTPNTTAKQKRRNRIAYLPQLKPAGQALPVNAAARAARRENDPRHCRWSDCGDCCHPLP